MMAKQHKPEVCLKDGEAKRIVSERIYRAGYVVRDEYWRSEFADKPKGHAILMRRQAYTPGGDRIGSSRVAHSLVVKRGIAPEKADPAHCVCSIGYSSKDRKWYGWSHRAICGFGIGDRIFDPNYGHDKTPFVRHGRRKIKWLWQAKEAAKAFAADVS